MPPAVLDAPAGEIKQRCLSHNDVTGPAVNFNSPTSRAHLQSGRFLLQEGTANIANGRAFRSIKRDLLALQQPSLLAVVIPEFHTVQLGLNDVGLSRLIHPVSTHIYPASRFQVDPFLRLEGNLAGGSIDLAPVFDKSDSGLLVQARYRYLSALKPERFMFGFKGITHRRDSPAFFSSDDFFCGKQFDLALLSSCGNCLDQTILPDFHGIHAHRSAVCDQLTIFRVQSALVRCYNNLAPRTHNLSVVLNRGAGCNYGSGLLIKLCPDQHRSLQVRFDSAAA